METGTRVNDTVDDKNKATPRTRFSHTILDLRQHAIEHYNFIRIIITDGTQTLLLLSEGGLVTTVIVDQTTEKIPNQVSLLRTIESRNI